MSHNDSPILSIKGTTTGLILSLAFSAKSILHILVFFDFHIIMATRGKVGKTASNALRSYNRIINNVTEQCDKYRELCKYFATLLCLHLNKVISERFQSHFSEYALMILKCFFV